MDYSSLDSRKFRRALRRAAGITAETGLETAVIWWKSGRKLLAVVIKGAHGAIFDPLSDGSGLPIPEFDWYEYTVSGYEADYCNVHFHPDTGAVCPSIDDLEIYQHASTWRQSRRFLLMGVARVGEDGGIDVLFIENSPSDYALMEIEEELKSFPFDIPLSSQGKVIELLQKYGLEVRLVSFPATRRRGA